MSISLSVERQSHRVKRLTVAGAVVLLVLAVAPPARAQQSGTLTVTTSGPSLQESGEWWLGQGGSLALTMAPSTGRNCVRFQFSGPAALPSVDVHVMSGSASVTVAPTTDGDYQALAVPYAGWNNNSSSCIGQAGTSLGAAFHVDRTGPVVTTSVAPAANANGWHRTDVDVTFAWVDAGVGTAAASPLVVPAGTAGTDYETPASGTEVTQTITDRLGNATSRSVTVKVDRTPPVLTLQFTSPESTGWYRTYPAALFSCHDVLSGLAECNFPPDPGPDGDAVVYTISGTDRAGNSSSASSLPLQVDRVRPTITAALTPQTPNGNGWYTAPVTVDWQCDDATSGIAVDGCPADDVIGTDGAAQVVSRTARDAAGWESLPASVSASIDQVAPVTTLSATTPSNTPINVQLNAQDTTSGVASTEYTIDGGAAVVGTSFTLQNPGTYSVAYRSIDTAGNEETWKTTTLVIDQTAPGIQATVSPPPNPAGWHNAPATVSFTCDASGGTPIAQCTSPVLVDTDGTALPVTGSAVDEAGNTASATTHISLDQVPPTVIADVNRTPSAFGWYGAEPTITFTCDDDRSGIPLDGCDAPVTLTLDGAGQAVTGNATDAAGNTGSSAPLSLDVDLTDPSILGAPDRPANAAGWWNGDVTVTWSCADDLSGVASCSAPVTVTAEGDGLPVTGQVTDRADRTADGQVLLRIDRSAPVTTSSTRTPSGPFGPVEVTLDGQDLLSGVVETTYAVDGGAPQAYTAPFTVTGPGAHTVEFSSRDAAGNVETLRTLAVDIPAAPVAPTADPVVPVAEEPEDPEAPEDPVLEPEEELQVAVGRIPDMTGPSDRVDTAIGASQDLFAPAGTAAFSGDVTRGVTQASAVVLASASAYPDALVGAPLAVRLGAPLLLTRADALDARVADELRRVLAPGGVVHLLGGEKALAPAVAEAIAQLGYQVNRYAGGNRYATAVVVAREALGNPERLLLATGDDFPDGLSAGAAAAYLPGAVLLTSGSTVPPELAEYLASRADAELFAIGGPAASAFPMAQPVVGADRYTTAVEVAARWFDPPNAIGIATGTAYPDALTGGTHVGHAGGPLLLTPLEGLHPAVAAWLNTTQAAGLENVWLYGGTSAVSPEVEADVRAAFG